MSPLLDEQGNMRSLEDVEAEMIRFSIDHHRGRMTKVARSLGIGRSTLYRKLKEHKIDVNNSASEPEDGETDEAA